MDPAATTTTASAATAMTTDLWCVVAIAFWGLLWAYVPVLGRILQAGVGWGFGNRHEPDEGPPWSQRAERAYLNHLANLSPFIALVLVLHVTGRHDDVSATASVVFVLSRVAHSLLYLAGIRYLRTFAFWASLGAMIVLAARLV